MLKCLLLIAALIGQAPDATAPTPLATTVRIIAFSHNAQGTWPSQTFSGTVVHSEPAYSAILTCSHGLTDTTDSDSIKVDLFDGVPQGTAQQAAKTETHNVTARTIDQTVDLAVLVIKPGRVLPRSKVALADWLPNVGDPMTASGCRRGANPNVYPCVVVARAVPLPANHIQPATDPEWRGIQCTKSASFGRSGSGLFDDCGLLVGVLSRCSHISGGDQPGANSVYANPGAIHRFLAKHNLSHVAK